MATNQSEQVIRVAVVDDDPMLLDVFSSLMKRSAKYHAHLFSDARLAFEKITEVKGRYHLVITDIRMPQVNGLEFARKIRQAEPDLPIILMTGDVPEGAREEAALLKKVAFLEKPFPLEETLEIFIPRLLKGEIS